MAHRRAGPHSNPNGPVLTVVDHIGEDDLMGATVASDADADDASAPLLPPVGAAGASPASHRDAGEDGFPAHMPSCQHLHARGPRPQRTAVSKLVCASCVVAVFMGLELAAGYVAGSIALLSDALHLLSDLAGMVLSLVALRLSARPPSRRYTYGFHLIEPLGALGSVVLIWTVTAHLLWHAVQRLLEPTVVDGSLMLMTATGGLLVNLVILTVLGGHSHGHSHGHDTNGGDSGANGHHTHGQHGRHQFATHAGGDVNVQAAWVHAIGDVLQSLGVMLAAALIWVNPEWSVADPVCTIVFAVIVMFTTVNVTRTVVRELLNACPPGVNADEVIRRLRSVPAVSSVHDVHVWSIGCSQLAVSAHVVSKRPDDALVGCLRVCEQLRVVHPTLQIEGFGSVAATQCAAATISRTCTGTQWYGGGRAAASAREPPLFDDSDGSGGGGGGHGDGLGV